MSAADEYGSNSQPTISLDSDKISTYSQTQEDTHTNECLSIQIQPISINQYIYQQNRFAILFNKLRKTLNSTTKADKYVRLISSCIKLLRASNPSMKIKYSSIYQQILKLRQIIRWNGLYETIQQFHQKGRSNFSGQNLFEFFFKCFQLFGDILDRVMFGMDLISNHSHSLFYQRIQRLQADCYFVQCIIWMVYHGRSAHKTREKRQRIIKMAKFIKYCIDSLTSYCKFSRRVIQLAPKTIAILNIISSVIGIFVILY